MSKPEFVYCTYIKTTAEKLWQALTELEFTRQYWGLVTADKWAVGEEWKLADPINGEIKVVGKVLECEPPKRLLLSWIDPTNDADKSEASFDIEAIEDMVRLTVIHSKFVADTNMPERIAMGWPRVLSSLKSMLESGIPLNTWAGKEMTCVKK